MSVVLEPSELGFKRPFQKEVSQNLRLSNPHNDPIAFKVKTTAPKQYCVRPNSGRIDAGGYVEVQVLLQAMKDDPPMDAKCRDKFLVQSVAVTTDREFTNVAAVWQQIEQTAKSSIQERKIRVVFLPADGGAATPAKSNGLDPHDNTIHRSPSPEMVTPQKQSSATALGSSTRSDTRSLDNKGTPSATSHASRNSTGTGQSTLAQSSSGELGQSLVDSLKSQLAEAKFTIARMQHNNDDQGLRQRKGDSVTAGVKDKLATQSPRANLQNSPASGVPVQIVAALCLLSFLLAYFLF